MLRHENMKMLEIKDLKAGIGGTEILTGLSISVRPGEVHAIMGPNGSGKSTLAQVIAGNEDYAIHDGTVEFLGENLLDLSERDIRGIEKYAGRLAADCRSYAVTEPRLG